MFVSENAVYILAWRQSSSWWTHSIRKPNVYFYIGLFCLLNCSLQFTNPGSLHDKRIPSWESIIPPAWSRHFFNIQLDKKCTQPWTPQKVGIKPIVPLGLHAHLFDGQLDNPGTTFWTPSSGGSGLHFYSWKMEHFTVGKSEAKPGRFLTHFKNSGLGIIVKGSSKSRKPFYSWTKTI